MAPPISDIAYAAYVISTVTAKSTFEYYWHGPRLPSWDLKFQVRRDIMNYFISHGMPQLKNDDGIEDLDIYALTSTMRAKGLQETQLPEEKGLYRAFNIPVRSVDIDVRRFAAAGVAREALVKLAEADRTGEGLERTIGCEVVAATEALDALAKHTRGKDTLLACKPVHDDERIVVYLHGGGYVIGSPASHRSLAGSISKESQARVIPIDYRLTPKHPFPAHVHDVLIAYVYLTDQGFKAENIVVAGDSAGAHLGLAFVHLARLIGIPQPGGLVLLSPWGDLVTTKASLERNKEYDYLVMQPITSPLSYARMFYAPGCPLTEQMRREMADPLVSPINGSFKGFAPTLIQAGAKELLVDDITDLYTAIRDQNPGSPGLVVFEPYDDMNHVFQVFSDRPESAKAIASIGTFIKGLH
ncbi:hypothetical protein GQ54DRAFT_196526 [Martensiomyces pterosporus]|nr:hypothetical protein GQ54DRAFT_196526 [Martensiomyces pterosporus]